MVLLSNLFDYKHKKKSSTNTVKLNI